MIMKRNIIVSVVFFIIVLSTNVFGQPAKEAVMALKDIQIRCETGILYKDYAPVLAKAKIPVSLYLESAEAKNTPNLSEALKMAITHYDNAQKIWDAKYSPDKKVYNYVCSTFNPSLYDRMIRAYPDIKVTENSLLITSIPCFNIDEAVQLIWSKAAGEIGNASDFLAHPERETVAEPVEKKAGPGQSKDIMPDLQKRIDDLIKENERQKDENDKLKKQLEELKTKSN
jgi:hypothetical protein